MQLTQEDLAVEVVAKLPFLKLARLVQQRKVSAVVMELTDLPQVVVVQVQWVITPLEVFLTQVAALAALVRLQVLLDHRLLTQAAVEVVAILLAGLVQMVAVQVELNSRTVLSEALTRAAAVEVQDLLILAALPMVLLEAQALLF
jgi:hypothetical protein